MTAKQVQVFDEAYNAIKLDPDYKRTKEEMILLSRQVIEKLGPDYNLFLRLEELFYHAKSIRLKQIYELAQQDNR